VLKRSFATNSIEVKSVDPAGRWLRKVDGVHTWAAKNDIAVHISADGNAGNGSRPHTSQAARKNAEPSKGSVVLLV